MRRTPRNQVKRHRRQGGASGWPMIVAFLVMGLGGLFLAWGGSEVYQLAGDSAQAGDIRSVGVALGGLGLCSMVCAVAVAGVWAGGADL